MLTSNRDPSEWLGFMADPLLAQSAVDRLKSAAWELVIEGESYRQHEKPSIGADRRRLRRHADNGALDKRTGCRDHLASRSLRARGGPMLLATGWSLGTGKRLAMTRHERPTLGHMRAPSAFDSANVVTHAAELSSTSVRVASGLDDPFHPGVLSLIEQLPRGATVDLSKGCHTEPFFLSQELPSLVYLGRHLTG